ncbi:MAG: thioredoxin family protein [Bryobacterales bacterium]|nr:thioredoxin family protein [Bryobacterales bacterium]
MALTESTMLELGVEAPPFALQDVVNGETISFDDVAGEKGTLVMFLCAHCPFVIHVQQELAKIGKDYQDKPIGVVAISSNDVGTHPKDGPDNLRQQAQEQDFRFPYLFDSTQETAKAYTAACTPDFFLFDRDRRLVYRGQLDASRPGNDTPVTGDDLRAALDAVLYDTAVSVDQKPSAGCNIKWKPGAEPGYYG